VLLLKGVLNFYRDNGSNVYVCFLDASKAFDRVNYNILFNKLAKRNIPGYYYYVCCCVGIVPNLAVFYGHVSFPKPLTSQMVLDKVYYHLSYLLCISMALPINCKWLMLVVMLAVMF